MGVLDLLLDPEIVGLLLLALLAIGALIVQPIREARQIIRRRRLDGERRDAANATRPMPTVPPRLVASDHRQRTVRRLPGAQLRKPDVWCADGSEDPAVRDGLASTTLLRGDTATRTSSLADDVRSRLIR